MSGINVWFSARGGTHHKIYGLLLISALISGFLLEGGLTTSSDSAPTRSGESRFATLVLKNGTVVTVDTLIPRVQAVAINGERIAAVGSDSEIAGWIGPHTEVIDCQGRLVLPGFNDAHCHLLSGGMSLLQVNLQGSTTPAEVQRRIAEQAQVLPPGVWIRGRGWDQTLFNNGEWPDKKLLDVVANGHPIFLYRVDGHIAWANSLALRSAKIEANTPDPPGGKILKDPDTGEPTGILMENATELVATIIPAPSWLELEQAVKKALEEARRCGVTSLQELSDRKVFAVYRDLLTRGELSCRISAWLPLEESSRRGAVADSLKDIFPQNSNLLRTGLLKGFVDGTMGSRTAALFAPYADDSVSSGIALYTQDSLNDIVRIADSLGFQIGLHAIGDRANFMALTAFDYAMRTNRPSERRHRLEHAQLLRKEDIDYCARLKVVASMQPTHCTSDMRWAEERVGAERCQVAYAWRRFLQAGVPLAFGSDWPVEPLDPMEGIYSAVTRQSRQDGTPEGGWFPEQRLTLEQALRAYTLGSAYAEFQEDKKGTITPGKLADIVLLNQNLFEILPREILKTRVDFTILGGKIVYQRK